MSKGKESAYAAAGVDIDAMDEALAKAKRDIQSTMTSGVVGHIGAFGGLHESPGAGNLLVTSIDGVGTKLKVAAMAGRHDTVGQDLVNHCVNDILVQGAKPLLFMDYVGTSTLEPDMFAEIVSGLSKACRENGCALLSGETAEMPGLYPEGEYDLVGAIVGTVPRDGVITGDSIRPGDGIIGLRSTGLQTNGYSLARRIVFDKLGLSVDDTIPGADISVADALLAVHASFFHPAMELMGSVSIRGMAHITGGGLVDNIPRILPAGVSARIEKESWDTPAIFRFLEEEGDVDAEEMYRVFNMGIGYAIIVDSGDIDAAMNVLRGSAADPIVIGEVVEGDGDVVLV